MLTFQSSSYGNERNPRSILEKSIIVNGRKKSIFLKTSTGRSVNEYRMFPFTEKANNPITISNLTGSEETVWWLHPRATYKKWLTEFFFRFNHWEPAGMTGGGFLFYTIQIDETGHNHMKSSAKSQKIPSLLKAEKISK